MPSPAEIPPFNSSTPPSSVDVPSLPQLQALVLTKWPPLAPPAIDWIQPWLTNLHLTDDQWLCMAKLSTITTAAKAQDLLNRIRNERVLGESVARDRKGKGVERLGGEKEEWVAGELKRVSIGDIIQAVDELERVKKREGRK